MQKASTVQTVRRSLKRTAALHYRRGSRPCAFRRGSIRSGQPAPGFPPAARDFAGSRNCRQRGGPYVAAGPCQSQTCALDRPSGPLPGMGHEAQHQFSGSEPVPQPPGVAHIRLLRPFGARFDCACVRCSRNCSSRPATPAFSTAPPIPSPPRRWDRRTNRVKTPGLCRARRPKLPRIPGSVAPTKARIRQYPRLCAAHEGRSSREFRPE